MTAEAGKFSNDLNRIAELQAIFDSAFGHSLKDKLLSYNPVIEWWNFENLKENQGIEFRLHSIKQIETALRERFHTSKSPVDYLIDQENNLRNELWPNEPFTLVLERGIAYRKENGSQETEREEGELDGFKKIQDYLLNPITQMGSKMIVISGPGLVEKTAYDHNFVDIYEKTTNKEGQIVIRMTRMASSMDYSQYAQRALLFNPSYFDGFEGSIDAWFLSHPIPVKPQAKFETPDDIFEKMFEKKKGTMREDEFQELFEECMPVILNYINILCQKEYNPKEIGIAFNAILNKADYHKDGGKQIRAVFNNAREEALWLGNQPVAQIPGDCGISAGFSPNTLINSVGRFGLTKEIMKCVNCPFCHQTVDAEIYAGRIHCPKCNESVAIPSNGRK